MKRQGILLAAVFFVLFGASQARAEITITPFIGSLFSGDLPDSKADYGASATFMGNGIFGAEVLFNYAPNFVSETATNNAVAQAGLMGNLMVGVPIGGDAGKTLRSSRRLATPSLVKIFLRWYSTVLELMNSSPPISGLVRPAAASRAIWVS